MKERTLILVKHDGVLKGLVGEIIKRFESIGLNVVGMKMIWADEGLADKHYLTTPEWIKTLADKTRKAFKERGIELKDTDEQLAGRVKDWNKKFLKEGPVVAIVFEGPHAVELGRKLVGHTEPRQALPGTIRGDYSFDSYQLGDKEQRPIRNLVHASGTQEEAEREIALWFKKNEIYEYKKE